MGRRGPTPRPSRLKLLEGNPGKRPLRENLKPQPRRPTCPSWLWPEARAEWRRLAPELERLGLLTPLDRAAFAGYCQSYAHWHRCQRVLEEHGHTYLTASARLKERPEVEMAKQTGQLMRAFAAEFGLTPASRARMAVPATADDSDDCPRCSMPVFVLNGERQTLEMMSDEELNQVEGILRGDGTSG